MDKNEAIHRIYVGRLCELTPTVNFANRMQTVAGQTWGPRIIPDCQLLYIVEGSAVLRLGSQTRLLSAGDCVFYGSRNPHQIVSSETTPCLFTSIHFNWQSDSLDAVHPITGIQDCSNRDLNSQLAVYTLDVDGYGEVEFPHYLIIPYVEDMFMRIVKEYRIEPFGSGLMLRSLLSELLITIVRHQISHIEQSVQRNRIAPALEAIQKSVQKNWSVQELATLCGYHPTYFAALFKEVTGSSPKHYQILARIQRAKEVLLATDTAQQAAEELGFTSVHYFCRSFKAVTGLTPTQFKQQNNEL